MSRIGKQPIPLPEGVEVAINDQVVAVKGAKGTLEVEVEHPGPPASYPGFPETQ